MSQFLKVKLGPGVYWLEHNKSNLRILCGPIADSIKLLIRRGFVQEMETAKQAFEVGPNAILLSDLSIQNGDICNLSEFPILQMLYRQGFLIPGHHQNNGQKPLVIGSKKQVNNQLAYLYRGNYGLASESELEGVCSSREEVAMMMKVKRYFAFDNISLANEFIDGLVVEESEQKINDQVSVKRLDPNHFEFFDENESIRVNLNLKIDESYPLPIQLNPVALQDQFFSVIHSGEGDGWDVNRGCMGSVICFDNKYYLIDAAPHVKKTLDALGISLSKLEGVFMTHAHDDHFAGLCDLIQAPKPIKIFATAWVRKSICKKFSALLGFEEEVLNNFFEVIDLSPGVWNDINGLEVRPVYSPHPIETNIFKFRVLWSQGYIRYHHLADITSAKVLADMTAKGKLSGAMEKAVRSEYMESAAVKKVDIGGGLIHGMAEDFAGDTSDKIIFAHTSTDLSTQQKQIGSSATFGSMDVLIPQQSLYPRSYIEESLKNYFPKVDSVEFRFFAQCPIVNYGPGSIIVKSPDVNSQILLIVSGVVERIETQSQVACEVMAGTIIGDGDLSDKSLPCIFRTKSYVDILEIPRKLYTKFLRKQGAFKVIETLYDLRAKVSHLPQLSFLSASAQYFTTLADLEELVLAAQTEIDLEGLKLHKQFFVVYSGSVQVEYDNGQSVNLGSGDVWFNEQIFTNKPVLGKACTLEKTHLLVFKEKCLDNTPILRWKLLEVFFQREILFAGQKINSAKSA